MHARILHCTIKENHLQLTDYFFCSLKLCFISCSKTSGFVESVQEASTTSESAPQRSLSSAPHRHAFNTPRTSRFSQTTARCHHSRRRRLRTACKLEATTTSLQVVITIMHCWTRLCFCREVWAMKNRQQKWRTLKDSWKILITSLNKTSSADVSSECNVGWKQVLSRKRAAASRCDVFELRRIKILLTVSCLRRILAFYNRIYLYIYLLLLHDLFAKQYDYDVVSNTSVAWF